MVGINTSFPLENMRLTAEQYNRFASFGKVNSADEQQFLVMNFLTHVATNETTGQCQCPLDCLIKLFIQGVVLEAFITQDFPVVCYGRPVQKIIEHKFNDLLMQHLHPSTTVSVINTLLSEMETALQNLSNKVRGG